MWPPAGTVAGGLGGNARFTKVSRGPSPRVLVVQNDNCILCEGYDIISPKS